MRYVMRFDSYERVDEGVQPDQARIFGALRLAYTLRPELGGQAMGGGTDLEAALEWSRLMRALGGDDLILRLHGGVFHLSAAAMAMIRSNWKAARDHMGASLAEDIQIMESFLKADGTVLGASLAVEEENEESE